LKGETAEDVASYVFGHADISGLRGPTIAKVYPPGGDGWYAVTVVVEKERLLAVVGHLRHMGGSSVTVSQPDYVFHSECRAHARLT
jgi:ATP phosphoribosyltransferase-like protein